MYLLYRSKLQEISQLLPTGPTFSPSNALDTTTLIVEDQVNQPNQLNPPPQPQGDTIPKEEGFWSTIALAFYRLFHPNTTNTTRYPPPNPIPANTNTNYNQPASYAAPIGNGIPHSPLYPNNMNSNGVNTLGGMQNFNTTPNQYTTTANNNSNGQKYNYSGGYPVYSGTIKAAENRYDYKIN